MSLLFETVRVTDGALLHPSYHVARMNRSRRELLGETGGIDIATAVKVPRRLAGGAFRCRIDYGRTIESVSFTPCVRRPVTTLTLVDAGGLDYGHKYTDRSGIDRLLAAVATDDILIVRDGLVTDASHANVAFFDGERWITPARPLLAGTARARLLDEGKIVPGDIDAGGLGGFLCATLFNAMMEFDPSVRIRMADIGR